MSANALESQGTKLYIDLGTVSPTSWTEITDAKDINFRTGSATVIDTTDLSSTAKEKRMGLPDEGQCTFTLMIRPADSAHAELMSAKSDRQIRDFRLTLTDTPNTDYRFSGYVLTVPMSISVDGVIESAITVEISGAVTTA